LSGRKRHPTAGGREKVEIGNKKTTWIRKREESEKRLPKKRGRDRMECKSDFTKKN